MSKAVGKILQVAALVVAVVAAIPTGGLSLATAAWINIGITAASILNAALLPRDRGPARAASETTLQLGETPRVAIFGEAAIAGSLVDAFNYGGKYGTDWEVVIIALADHRCEGLTGFYVNDRYFTFGGDGAVPGFNNQLQVYFRPGTMTQTLPAIVTTNGPGWTAASNGAGVAYVVVAYKADDPEAKNPVWPGGRPRFLWVVKGARCYIPRKDSSVGGAGAHRRNDPATWEWTDNLIDCRYNWVRGIYAGDQVGDPTKLLVGRGLTAEEAPPENTFAPANLCDELVGGEKRYRVAGSVMANERYLDVEERFAAACGGILVQREGSVEIEPGQAKAAVAFITDADVLVGSTVEYTDYLSEADREWVNTVIPRYVEPSQKWADHAAPIRRDTDDIIADGGPREETLSLSMVRYARQAGAVGEQFRRLGRLWRRGKVTLGPRFAGIEEGDWIVWTSARRTNSISRVFRVQAYGLDGRWQNTLQLREIGTSVFSEGAFLPDQSAQDQGLAPPAIGAPGAGAWALSAVSLDGESGSFPALRVTGVVDDDKARGVRIEYIVADVGAPGDDAEWLQDGVYGVNLRRRDIAGVAPETEYYVAISYIVDGVPGDRRILGPVTASASISEATYEDGTPIDELKPAEPGATRGAPTGTIVHDRDAEQVAADLDLNALNILAEMTVAGTWRAEQDTLLYDENGQPIRTVVEQLGVDTGEVQVFITELKSVSGDGTGKALFAINANGTIVGTRYLAGGGQSSIDFLAAQFRFVDNSGENPITAFEYEGGVWKMKSLEVDTLAVNSVDTQNILSGAIGRMALWEYIYPTANDGYTASSLMAVGDTNGVWSDFGPAGSPSIIWFDNVPVGAVVRIDWLLKCRRTGNNNDFIRWRIVRSDNTVLQESPQFEMTADEIPYVWSFIDQNVPAYTTVGYKVQAFKISGNPKLNQLKLMGTILKK